MLVFVVGETQRAQNYSLNGYQTNHTNDFTKHLDILSLSNFYSCGTATAKSLPCMFSRLGRDNFDINRVNNTQNAVDIV
ncbi:MAG: sulfatase-like hydrolase/transferase [Campylobacter sp.]|nr:sulfatase-like hydrolase/transferase [Campylobacter sp.]